MWQFDEEYYQGLARQHHDAHRQADPYPHSVIDDFLPPEVCEGLLRSSGPTRPRVAARR